MTADARLLDLAPHLRAVSTISVGFDHIDLAAAAQRGITVTHTPVLSDAVADLTLGLILMTARRLGEAVDIVANGGWDDALLGVDLRGKTLLIVGLGRIGREVARRAAGFKMHVCGFDARTELPEIDGVERVATLAEGLARADFVSLHVDLNPSTRHLLDDDAFAHDEADRVPRSTPRAVVSSTRARSRVRSPSGASPAPGLDVLEVEPPPAGRAAARDAERRRAPPHRVGDGRDPPGDARLRGDEPRDLSARRPVRVRARTPVKRRQDSTRNTG